jgi:hypothetical protein
MYLSWFDRYHFYADLDQVDDDLARQIRQLVGAGGVPLTPIGIANWAGYSFGHRGRRLREAIELSKWIALRKLKAKLGGIKLDDVWPLLFEICHDLALYIGGSAVAGGVLGAAVGSMGLGIGAVPGALAGTAAGVQIGQMLLGFIGLKSVIEYMLDHLPVAIDEYRKGFLISWGPMPSMQDMFSETPASRYNFESNAMAAGNFARGHEIIIIALLMGIVTYLGRGKGNLKALIAEASSHSKLGPRFATWLEQNERELSAIPVLQTPRKVGRQAGTEPRPNDAGSSHKVTIAEGDSRMRQIAPVRSNRASRLELFNTTGPGIPLDPVRLSRMKAAFERNGGVVDQGAGAKAYLEMRGAEGVTFDAKTILLPENPTTSAVFEEFIHTGQHRTGLVNRYTELYGNGAAQLRLEMEAAEKLINNRRPYRIPNTETRGTIQRLREYREQLGGKK